jgi:small subunit ribosomal protein S16
MAVRMRLMRMGKTKQPVYRVVVIDQRAPRDGRYIEQIGRYDARQEPSLVEIDNERATDWLAKGAQPSETVEKLLNISGAMNTMKIRTGGIHVVGVEKAKPAPAEAPATAEAEGSDTSEESATDGPATGGNSETEAPAAGGGSEGGRPPSDITEEE